jgi:hypothetical protein
MTGPWLTGSSPGFDALNAEPTLGVLRRLASELLPRHAVLAVATRSWNWFSLPSHGDVAPANGPGR